MKDIHFNSVPIFINEQLPTNEVIVVNCHKHGTPIVWKPANPATDEERQVLEVANRLLDRTGPALTLDIMQQAFNNVHQQTGHAPVSIIMHPSILREYIKLIHSDLTPANRYLHNSGSE